MRYSSPSAPPPILYCKEPALEFSFMCNSEMVSQLGDPTIGAIFRNVKLSRILSIVEGVMGMLCSNQL